MQNEFVVGDGCRIHGWQGATGRGELRGEKPQCLVKEPGRPHVRGETELGPDLTEGVAALGSWPSPHQCNHHSCRQYDG